MALKDFEGVEIRVIGQGMEKYMTLSLGKYLVFKDSLQFLGSSLATLAKNLLKTDSRVSNISHRNSSGLRRRSCGYSCGRGVPVRVYG